MESTVKAGLVAAVRSLLKPLVRLLIKQGVSFGEFSEVAKHVFVEVAVRDFRPENRPVTQSRAAVLTGLTRKEVRRVINTTLRSEPEFRTESNRLVRVLQAWHTEPDFIGPYGLPLELPWDSNEARIPSFSELVRRHSGDMTPRQILDELVRAGAVQETDSGWYKVLRRDYEPVPLDPSSLERFGTVVNRFIRTVSENLEKEKAESGKFERIVFTDAAIRRRDVQLFDIWIKREGQTFLERIDDWFVTNTSEAPPGGLGDTEPTFTGIGMYHYTTAGKEEIPFREYLENAGVRATGDVDKEEE